MCTGVTIGIDFEQVIAFLCKEITFVFKYQGCLRYSILSLCSGESTPILDNQIDLICNKIAVHAIYHVVMTFT